jgi:hypothetical protein
LKLYDSFWNTLILSYQEFEGWLWSYFNIKVFSSY